MCAKVFLRVLLSVASIERELGVSGVGVECGSMGVALLPVLCLGAAPLIGKSSVWTVKSLIRHSEGYEAHLSSTGKDVVLGYMIGCLTKLWRLRFDVRSLGVILERVH